MTDPKEIMILEDEAGNEIEFEVVDLVEFEKQDYLLLRPLEGGVLDDADDVLVLRLSEDGEEVDFIQDDAEFARFAAHLETLGAE